MDWTDRRLPQRVSSGEGSDLSHARLQTAEKTAIANHAPDRPDLQRAGWEPLVTRRGAFVRTLAPGSVGVAEAAQPFLEVRKLPLPTKHP